MFANELDSALRLNSRLLHCAGLAATVVVATFLQFAVFRPLSAAREETLHETAVVEATLTRASDIRSENRTLRNELATAERRVADALRRVPAIPHEADFLAQVTELAHASGLDILDYRPGAIQNFEKHNSMAVQLSSQGNYPGLCKFLHSVDQLPRLCRVDHLEIIAPQQPGSRASMNMTLVIFFAPVSEKTAEKGASRG